jgi:hypothetical protein
MEDYIVLSADSFEELRKVVLKKHKKGYICLGGMVPLSRFLLSQTMILKKEEVENFGTLK